MTAAAGVSTPVVELRGARMAYGQRTLWSGLDLRVEAGEFLAVLGPNGTGKTRLLRALLGQEHLSAGSARILGAPARTGNPAIGYIPQQRAGDPGPAVRARDLVALGLTGHRWGPPLASRAQRRQVDRVLAAVGAQAFAKAPVAELSGGEQQRVRVAQAVVGEPRLLLCDEPLNALDLAQQRIIAGLINRERSLRDAAVMFVTHDVNPVLPFVDRVLYLARGAFRIGTPDQVLRSEVLSELYGTEVRVLRLDDRVIVVGGDGEEHVHAHHPAVPEDEHTELPDAPEAGQAGAEARR